MVGSAIQFVVTPSFDHLLLGDDDVVAKALDAVLQSRARQDTDGSLLRAIIGQTGASTVGELRRLTEHAWRGLDLPAICCVYLKHVVRQSMCSKPSKGKSSAPIPLSTSSSSSSSPQSSTASSTASPQLQQLERDFNFGSPFDESAYEAGLVPLQSMGFTREVALEALVVTGNKGLEVALEFCFLEKSEQAQRREAAMHNMPPCSPYIQGGGGARGPGTDAELKQLKQELAALKQKHVQDKQNLKHIQFILEQDTANATRNGYKEFLRGIISGGQITREQFNKMVLYRGDKNISLKEHSEILRSLGLSKDDFENLKDYTVKRDNECVVCLEKPKTHAILDCMHLCLCDTCSKNFKGPKAVCPICSMKVSSVRRIFT